MKALMLAAGVGLRLSPDSDDGHPPKALLPFDDKTLLHRHVEILLKFGIEELVLVVGCRANEIADEIDAIGARDFVRTIYNPDYRLGSVVSLWMAREDLRCDKSILLMDADVLYHPLLIERLAMSNHADCFLIDRDFEPGDEPVKLCLRDGVVIEFRKKIDVIYDVIGEWPGFLRMSPRIAKRVAEAVQSYVSARRTEEPHEEAIRDIILSEPAATFGVEDITGLPWIEIDFQSDIRRAEKDILPRLREASETTFRARASGGGRPVASPSGARDRSRT